MEEKVSEFTADELRWIADAMDNPALRQGMNMGEFIGRVSLK